MECGGLTPLFPPRSIWRPLTGRAGTSRPTLPPFFIPQLLPNHTRRARVQGLPSNSSYGGGASLWFGQGARASRPSRSKPIGRMPMPHPNDLGCGRPARVVFRKTGETPVPPGLRPPSYSQTTPANARVQGLGAVSPSLRWEIGMIVSQLRAGKSFHGTAVKTRLA